MLGLEDLCAVNRDRQMLGIHAVLIGPQLGAGIRTIGVNGKACNNLGIGDDNSKVVVLSVICFSNLNSSLTGSAVVAVVESAPGHREIRCLLLTKEQDCFAVGVEGAPSTSRRAAPGPDGYWLGISF